MHRIFIEMELEEFRQIMKDMIEAVLSNKDSKVLPDTLTEVLNVEQVCSFLNMKKSTLYQLTHKSKIPYSKKGKALYFIRSEILAWLSEGHNISQEEQRNVSDLMLLKANNKKFLSINHNL